MLFGKQKHTKTESYEARNAVRGFVFFNALFLQIQNNSINTHTHTHIIVGIINMFVYVGALL